MSKINYRQAVLPTAHLVDIFMDTTSTMICQNYDIDYIAQELIGMMSAIHSDDTPLRAHAERCGEMMMEAAFDEVACLESTKDALLEIHSTMARAVYELGIGLRGLLMSAGLYDKNGTLRCDFLKWTGKDMVVVLM